MQNLFFGLLDNDSFLKGVMDSMPPSQVMDTPVVTFDVAVLG
jgi:hypothetical protein